MPKPTARASTLIAGACTALLAASSGAAAQEEDASGEPSPEVANPEEVPVPHDPTDEEPECYPPCRKAFTCYQGECISLCNPPCPEGERCTEEGECELVTPPTRAEAENQPEEPAPEPSSPELSPRFNRTGLSLRLAIGPSMCIGFDDNGHQMGSEFGDDGETAYPCNSFEGKDKEVGAAFNLSAGWRFTPWTTVEAGFTITTHGQDAHDSAWGDMTTTNFWLAPRLGMRFYPLGSRYRVDLVLALHTAYVRMQQNVTQELIGVTAEGAPYSSGETLEGRFWLEGVQLDWVAGLEIHLNSWLSAGVEVTVFENIWTSECYEWNGPNPNGEEDQDCGGFDRKQNDLFINLDLVLAAVFG